MQPKDERLGKQKVGSGRLIKKGPKRTAVVRSGTRNGQAFSFITFPKNGSDVVSDYAAVNTGACHLCLFLLMK